MSRAFPSELEVDERCHALGPHRVNDEQREGQHDRLGRYRRLKRAMIASGRCRGRYCEPTPTAMAATTPDVTSGEARPRR